MKNTKNKDKYSYKGWLISDRFWKRAWAVLGYSLAPMAVIYGAFLIILLIIFLIVVLISL